MWQILTEPLSALLGVATLAVLIGLRTRWATWVACVGLGVVALALVAACFDGRAHVSPKFDATTLVWAGVVARRGLSGIVLLVLSLPLARAFDGRGICTPFWLAGLVLGALPGAALIASNLLLQSALRTILATSATAEGDKLRVLANAIYTSHAVLVAAALAVLIGSVWLVRRGTPAPAGL